MFVCTVAACATPSPVVLPENPKIKVESVTRDDAGLHYRLDVNYETRLLDLVVDDGPHHIVVKDGDGNELVRATRSSEEPAGEASAKGVEIGESLRNLSFASASQLPSRLLYAQDTVG